MGAAFVTWISFRTVDFSITKGRAKQFASSPGVARGFCGGCGTSLTFTSERKPDQIVVTSCSLDDPESIAPATHEWIQTRCSWIVLADGLPGHEGRPPT